MSRFQQEKKSEKKKPLISLKPNRIEDAVDLIVKD